MKILFYAALLLCTSMAVAPVQGQTYVPVAVTGYNSDVFAETGTNAVAVSTTSLDLSNNLLYTKAFAIANGIQGGMPDNGTITGNGRTYQLDSYADSNGLYLAANGAVTGTQATGNLTLATPDSLNLLSLLVFSTEGNSTLKVTLHFTDGTSVLGGLSTVLDWFGGINYFFGSFGRISRNAAGPYTADGIAASNPRFYTFDIAIACANQSKLLQSITVDYMFGSGTSSRAVVLAVAGVRHKPVVLAPVVTPAVCGTSAVGGIALNVTGGAEPLSYWWNTTPAQVTASITNVPPGNYSCTITDASGCRTIYNGSVPLTSTTKVTVVASPAQVCAGRPTTLTAVVTGSTVASYTWNPGNITGGASTTVLPVASTTYTVTGQDATGCPVSGSVLVTVNPIPVPPVVAGTTICPGSTSSLSVQNPVAGNTYNWYNVATGGTLAGTGITYTTPSNNAVTTYYAEASNAGCAGPRTPATVNLFVPLGSPAITITEVTASSVTISWTSVTGATGYQVAVNNGNFITPSSGANGTTHKATGIPIGQMAVFKVIALGNPQCRNSVAATVTARTLPGEVFIPSAFTPNGDGKNDEFKMQSDVVAEADLKIFNQWGQLIYSSRQLSQGWNGRHKGVLQPMGLYVYVVKMKLTDGSEVTRKGNIHLIR